MRGVARASGRRGSRARGRSREPQEGVGGGGSGARGPGRAVGVSPDDVGPGAGGRTGRPGRSRRDAGGRGVPRAARPGPWHAGTGGGGGGGQGRNEVPGAKPRTKGPTTRLRLRRARVCFHGPEGAPTMRLRALRFGPGARTVASIGP